MNILQIEDEVDWFEETVKPLLENIGVKNIYHEVYFEQAIDTLANKEVDYLILDLALPVSLSEPVPDISTGIRLASFVRENYPGTPILILTGQQTEEAVQQFVEDQEVTTFWDGTKKSLVKVRPKRSIKEAVALLAESVKELRAIDSIEIEERECKLNLIEKRVIQIFAKESSAIAARVVSLNGGLSSAKVLEVNLIAANGTPLPWTSLVKIDTNKNIDHESNNFHTHVNKLPVGSYPTILNEYVAGCADKKGICYRFATDYKSNLFSFLTSDEESALVVLTKLKSILDMWNRAKCIKPVTVGEIRQLICPDHKYLQLEDIRAEFGLDEFESKSLNANFCIQHCDLHGLNILVSEELQPIIIDYGDINESTSVLDIVTLELSKYFHPEVSDSVPVNMDLFKNWFDTEKHIELSEFKEITKFLRNWKTENSFMEREYIVTVYSYALRQLTYKGTNHEIAKALISSAIAVY